MKFLTFLVLALAAVLIFNGTPAPALAAYAVLAGAALATGVLAGASANQSLFFWRLKRHMRKGGSR